MPLNLVYPFRASLTVLFVPCMNYTLISKKITMLFVLTLLFFKKLTINYLTIKITK